MATTLFFRQTVHIIAPPEKVWDALINPEITPQYMSGCEVVSDWLPGNPITWRNVTNKVEYIKGNVITFEPEKELSYTAFDPAAGYIDDPTNYLTTSYKLFQENNGTRLEVSLGDFASVENGEIRYREAEINWEMTLNSFKRLLED